MAKPIQDYSVGGLSVAVWAQEKGVSISMQKRYLDKDSDEWKESKFLFVSETAILIQLLQKAIADHGMKIKTNTQEETSIDQF